MSTTNSHATISKLVAFLESPASYPHRPTTVRSTETHISWVFFAAPFVFKVKKPVNFGFLDFSSLEQRRHFCQREVELNRRLAPDIYCGVLPIYKKEESFAFEANGEVAEYCVQMKELQDGFFLHQLLVKELVSEKEINRVISRLQEFYDSETSLPEKEGWGTPEKLRITTDENLALSEKFAGNTLTPGALATIRSFTNDFYESHTDLLKERVRQGRIRDCHGDLRLEHIHITPDRITIFDCIEFNDRLRFIDVANDLAFLAMDFDFEGHRDLGNLLLQNAARAFSDPDLLKLMDFYKCYRAAVRGKVESIEAASCASTQTAEHTSRAQRYFRLALRYATCGSQQIVLAVMGPVASGKSSVAQQLASELGFPIFSSDRIRKILANVPLTKWTAKDERERVYSDQMTTRTYETLLKDGLTALAGEGGVVLDATFSRRVHRDLLRDQCAKAKARLQLIELGTERSAIQRRLQAREDSAREISDARLEDFEKLTAAYEPPSEFGADLIRISTEDLIHDTVAKLLSEMAKNRCATKQSIARG